MYGDMANPWLCAQKCGEHPDCSQWSFSSDGVEEEWVRRRCWIKTGAFTAQTCSQRTQGMVAATADCMNSETNIGSTEPVTTTTTMDKTAYIEEQSGNSVTLSVWHDFLDIEDTALDN